MISVCSRFGWGRRATVQRWGSTSGSCRGERSSSADGRQRETQLRLFLLNLHLSIYPSIPTLFSPLVFHVVLLSWVDMFPLFLHRTHLSPTTTHRLSRCNQSPCSNQLELFSSIICHYVACVWRQLEVIMEPAFILCRKLSKQLFLHHAVLFTFIIKLFSLNGSMLMLRKPSSCLSNCLWWKKTDED